MRLNFAPAERDDEVEEVDMLDHLEVSVQLAINFDFSRSVIAISVILAARTIALSILAVSSDRKNATRTQS